MSSSYRQKSGGRHVRLPSPPASQPPDPVFLTQQASSLIWSHSWLLNRWQVLGSMGKTCEMGRAVVDSPLGKIEISGCEQGLHEIRLCGRKTLDPDPAEAPAPPKQLAGPEEMMEPLGQCAAWLDAYFRKPAVLQELPVPALHHPLFQQGQ
uniref:Methylguanine DNA methyltransferase ribonuclease-like domain-containing protein n=1 Tax=Sus scrofa TaxID=9823 RepID=A0A8D1H2D3_PIG